jgi:hypothetical protein
LHTRQLAVIFPAVLAALVLAYIAAASLLPPQIKMSPADASVEVSTDTEIKVGTSMFRGKVTGVEVKEVLLDPVGNGREERIIEGRLERGSFKPSEGTLLKTDARYEVTVSADLLDLTFTGPKHRSVTQTIQFQTIVTPAPIFVKDKQVVPLGEPIVVEFNTPVLAFTYDIAPSVQTTMHIDADNPSRAFIYLDEYAQGQLFQLTVTQAVSQKGVTLQQPYSQKVATTDPLKVVFIPGDGEAGVSLSQRPSLNFSEKIANRDEAESLVSIEPSVLGGWDWSDEQTLTFKPLHDWTQGAQITIRLQGGTEGLRGESGSFVREDVQGTFTTKPSKLIEVDLTAQKVMMYDNDQLVKTLICSSGSKATPSLTGRYSVYAKADKVDMRGDDYFAPNVPWVLMFNGDYTIHGNYWATQFGVPTSHGCVGLPVDDAHYLYDWTPIGTIIDIHY